MSFIYADTSALVRAYFADEPDHLDLRRLLLEGNDSVLTSEVAGVELAGAVRAAVQAGRLRRAGPMLSRMDADSSSAGPIQLIRFRAEAVLPTARTLVLEHRLRTLDAIHLAVAIEDTPTLAGGAAVDFVTRDREQGAAALALGFTVQ